MNHIAIAGRICGALMTLGSGGILLLLSNLLYRAIVIAAAAFRYFSFSVRKYIGNRTRPSL